MRTLVRAGFVPASGVLLILLCSLTSVLAQESTQTHSLPDTALTATKIPSKNGESMPEVLSAEQRIQFLERAIEHQAQQLEEMRRMLAQQQSTIQTLVSQLDKSGKDPIKLTEVVSLPEDKDALSKDESASTEEPTLVQDRLKQIEDRVLKLGPFKLSGDFRIRADGVFRSATKSPDPPVPSLQNVRATYRLRLNFDTDIYPTLSFHGQLATGAVNNQLTTNQEFSAIGVRHPFFLNEAWIDYHPNRSVQIQAGRLQSVFADNSRFIFDDDIRFSGFNEKYIWWLKSKPGGISNIEFRAGQYILTNPNVAIITDNSPLARAGEVVGKSGRSAALFHQGFLINQRFDNWGNQFGADIQLYRHPNQIQLASATDGAVLLIQPGIGIALSGPIGGRGTATTTPGGATYSAGSFHVGRLTYRFNHSGFRHGDHMFPITLNLQVARNLGTSLKERDAMLAALQVGRITKRGDISFFYLFVLKGANSMISQLTDDDLGVGSGVNIRNHHFRFEYGLAKKVTFQSLFFIQKQIRSSDQYPNFFVPLGAFTPRTYRFQQQLVFTF